MQVNFLTSYKQSLKRFLKKDTQLASTIEDTIKLLEFDKNDTRLKLKKIVCKKDKNRYSIRVINTSYRILLTVHNDNATLVCICSHDRYDNYNKNC